MLGRRAFFSAVLGREKGFLPLAPYCKDTSLFYKFCKDCESTPCISACDEVYNKDKGILNFQNGVVCVDFSAKGCKVCGKCAESCPNSVLDFELAKEKNPNWNFLVKISSLDCLAHKKILCNTCKDVCYSVLGRENAILFVGLFYPEIADSCIGCGECVSVCPTQAIVLSQKE